ncbi:MAG: hypothetical protein HYS78_01225 [Parcubacteria group bacterium]|nr:hypothetical protein [Parcubacteria group bacterium]
MGGLIKLIFSLILLTGVAVYSGDIWSGVKNRVSQFTNPELQRANIFETFKNNFGEIEDIVKEVNENIDNPDFDKKTKLEEAAKLIRESKDNFQKIEDSGETIIEKTFETARDLKEGIQSLITGKTKNDSQEYRCSQ